MGIDACIAFKAKLAPDIGSLPSGFNVVSAREYTQNDCPEATHEVDTCSRYYDFGYERGHWPDICAVLMSLHASKDVEKVWYSGDNVDTMEECPIERVLAISKHYMSVGRAYCKA